VCVHSEHFLPLWLPVRGEISGSLALQVVAPAAARPQKMDPGQTKPAKMSVEDRQGEVHARQSGRTRIRLRVV